MTAPQKKVPRVQFGPGHFVLLGLVRRGPSPDATCVSATRGVRGAVQPELLRRYVAMNRVKLLALVLLPLAVTTSQGQHISKYVQPAKAAAAGVGAGSPVYYIRTGLTR